MAKKVFRIEKHIPFILFVAEIEAKSLDAVLR
jgi:hypothetical protein